MGKKSSVAIGVYDLAKSFGEFTAVDHISFDVPKGKIFGLLGSNGAGKSTTIKMLTTLLSPTEGSAVIDGIDIVDEPEKVRQKIGYVPQLFSADPELTGYENMLLSAKLYNIPAKERKQRIQEMLQFMELEARAHTLVKFYSGGMIRKLEIAQATLHKPSVLFLDEPTVGLDPVARQLVWAHLHALRKQLDTTFILTTHDMEEADQLCDIIAFMNRGKISAIGEPTALKESVGKKASLNDVFVRYTGNSLEEGDSYENAKNTRKAISNLG